MAGLLQVFKMPVPQNVSPQKWDGGCNTFLDRKTFSLWPTSILWNDCVIKCSLAEWQIGFPSSTTLDQFVEMTCSYFKKDFEHQVWLEERRELVVNDITWIDHTCFCSQLFLSLANIIHTYFHFLPYWKPWRFQ